MERQWVPGVAEIPYRLLRLGLRSGFLSSVNMQELGCRSVALHEGWEQLAGRLKMLPLKLLPSDSEIWSMNSSKSWDVQKLKTELQGSSAGNWEAGAGDPSCQMAYFQFNLCSVGCWAWAYPTDWKEEPQGVCICIKAQDDIWCTWPSPAVGRREWVSMNTVWAVELSCCWFMFES